MKRSTTKQQRNKKFIFRSPQQKKWLIEFICEETHSTKKQQ